MEGEGVIAEGTESEVSFPLTSFINVTTIITHSTV